MLVLWCFPTSARIYFLSSPNCIYSNLVQDVLFLCTNFCYSVFFVGISAWNQFLCIYKNTDICKRLCLIEVVCHNADVGSIPAWTMWDSLWTRDITFFPAKCFISIIYQCSILELFIYKLSMWQHCSIKKNQSFLNSYCSVASILFILRCWFSLL